MHVIAALRAQRNPVTERREHLIGPRAQRDHGRACHERPVFGPDLPAVIHLHERRRVAAHERAAVTLEQPRIGLGQPARARHGLRVLPVKRAAEGVADTGLARAQRMRVEHGHPQPVRVGHALLRARFRVEQRGRTKRLDPAAVVHERLRVGAREQRIVLDDARRDERQQVARGGREPLRRRFAPEACEPARIRGQRAVVPIEIDGAVARIAQQRAEPARKRIRHDRRALDQSRIAVAGFLAGRAPVDERDAQPAILQMQRRRHADDAGPQNNHVEIHGSPHCVEMGCAVRRPRGRHAAALTSR